MVLGDSIPKYASAKETDVKYFKGHTVSQLSDLVFFGKVKVEGYSIIVIHAGTNDLNYLISSGKIGRMLPHQVLAYFQALRANIRRRNSSAIIQFSSVLPRIDDFQLYDPLIRGLNFAIEKWCAKAGPTCLFIPSWRWFVAKGQPVMAYYAKDGLHPNGAGNDVLQAGLQQSMVVANMLERARSRRTRRLAELPF